MVAAVPKSTSSGWAAMTRMRPFMGSSGTARSYGRPASGPERPINPQQQPHKPHFKVIDVTSLSFLDKRRNIDHFRDGECPPWVVRAPCQPAARATSSPGWLPGRPAVPHSCSARVNRKVTDAVCAYPVCALSDTRARRIVTPVPQVTAVVPNSVYADPAENGTQNSARGGLGVAAILAPPAKPVAATRNRCAGASPAAGGAQVCSSLANRNRVWYSARTGPERAG